MFYAKNPSVNAFGDRAPAFVIKGVYNTKTSGYPPPRPPRRGRLRSVVERRFRYTENSANLLKASLSFFARLASFENYSIDSR